MAEGRDAHDPCPILAGEDRDDLATALVAVNAGSVGGEVTPRALVSRHWVGPMARMSCVVGLRGRGRTRGLDLPGGGVGLRRGAGAGAGGVAQSRGKVAACSASLDDEPVRQPVELGRCNG